MSPRLNAWLSILMIEPNALRLAHLASHKSSIVAVHIEAFTVLLMFT